MVIVFESESYVKVPSSGDSPFILTDETSRSYDELIVSVSSKSSVCGSRSKDAGFTLIS